MSERISVRPYQPDDYNKVLELFIDGINSFHWIRSYSSVFGPSCVPFWTQVVAAGVLLWITPNYTTFLLAELLGQALLLAWNYNFYASYTRHALSTNMRDKNLESWTNHPQDVSGYLVAVTEGIVVGTISYKKVDADVLEIFRLSVDKNFRKLGIAKKLVNAVGQVGKKHGFISLLAMTTQHQTDAVSYYLRDGWTEVNRIPYPSHVKRVLYPSWVTYFLNGMMLVSFKKNIK